MRTAYVHDPGFTMYRFSGEHPLNPARLELTYILCRSAGLLEDADVIPPRQAAMDELLLWHSGDYIDVIRQMDETGSHPLAANYGFDSRDNIPFKGIFTASALRAGGTMAALDALLDGRCQAAFAPSGGFHHAMPATASGFCVFNDVVLAIKRLLAAALRVAYIDIDAHHADGVQAAFYSSPDVLVLSVHESGGTLFPGTGFVREAGQGPGLGYNINMPLAAGSGDDIYHAAASRLAAFVHAYKPDIIVAQLGSDAHTDDPLSHMNLTTIGYENLVGLIAKLAAESASGKLLAVGGGGYNLAVVPRCWALAFSHITGRKMTKLPSQLLHQPSWSGPPIASLRDPVPSTSGKRAWRHYHKTIRELVQLLPAAIITQ